MADIVSPETRSRMMSAIKGKDTKPEVKLRKALHAKGLRFRLHAKQLPGKPDLVFAKFRAVVFVHGCFWHRHENCSLAYTPKSRSEFWIEKFERNTVRDKNMLSQLAQLNWRCKLAWECEVRRSVEDVALDIHNWLMRT